MAESTHTIPMSTTLIWIVNDFEKFPVSNNSSIKSPVFTVGTNETWCIILQSNDNWLEPCVQLNTKDEVFNTKVSIKFSVINAEFRQMKEKCEYYTFTSCQNLCRFSEFIERGILLDTSRRLLCNGDLKVCCQIINYEGSQDQHHYDHQSTDWRLGRSLALLLENNYCSNFVIHVKDKQFLCHKFLLTCRCEYFSAMFRHQTKENEENKLVITDMEPRIFEKILLYIYTGEVDMNEADAYRVLLAADRFGLMRLKLLCEKMLHSCLSLENAAAIFTFASVHDLENLRTNAYRILTDFVKKTTKFEFMKAHQFSVQSNLVNALVNKKYYIDSVIQTKSLLPFKVNYWCKTENPVSEKNEWRIKNFRRKSQTSNSKTLHTHKCSIGECTWSISVSIETSDNSEGCCKELFVCFNLISDVDEKNFPFTFCEFALLTREHEEMCAVTHGFVFPPRKSVTFPVSSINSILSTSELLHGSDIIFNCSITSWKSALYKFTPPTIPNCDLKKNIHSLLMYKTCTDVVVCIQNQKFPCHKAILSCHSPFFASLFGEGKPELAEIKIEDIEPDVFTKILSAMYTGDCKLTVSEILQLFSLEKKYLFYNTICTFSDVFILALSARNAVDMLLFADDHKASNLKNVAIKFIRQNLKDVISSSGWSSIARREDLFLACMSAHIS